MKNYKKYFQLEADAADIYNALTNQVMIEIWTGEPAKFETKADTEFSIWDGAIVGRNLEFIEDKLIRQVWYFDEMESEVIIKLHQGDGSTSVEVRQNDIPDDAYENIATGWEEDYMGSLEELFNE